MWPPVLFLIGLFLLIIGLYFLLTGKARAGIGYGYRLINKDKNSGQYWLIVVVEILSGIVLIVLSIVSYYQMQ
jgi:hypothetical protein